MGGEAGGPAQPDDLLAQLARWAAGDRAARAASERARTRSLVEQAAATATWMGLLVDLAEAGTPVVATLRGGIRLSGRLAGVGRNFAVVQRPGGHPVLFRAGAVEGLVPAGAPASAAAGGRRAPALDLSLADALDAMAAERLPVSVRTAAETWSGTVVAHGEDYLTLRSEGADRRVIHVADAAVVAVELR